MQVRLALLITMFVAASMPANAHISKKPNAQKAIAFLEMVFNQKKVKEGFDKYVGDKYIQHNPLAADGPEGLKTFLAFAKQNIPKFRIEFKRTFADGDYVIVHGHARANPDDPADRGSAVMDIFRLENGKVVEHWDVAQPVPEKSNNVNTMF